MSTRAQVANPIVADMANVQDRIIGVELALKGAFKEEIAALDARLEELDEKMGVVATVEAAAKVKSEADAYAARTQADIDSLIARTRTAADAAASKLAGIEARESAVGTREASVAARAEKLDSREKSIADAQNSKDSELRDREAAVTKSEREAIARRAQLDKDIAAFNARLDALKV